MSGSWHIYRPGERWRRPSHEMRIVVATAVLDAVAFTVPMAELVSSAGLRRALAGLGPDPLSDGFDPAAAVARLRVRSGMTIGDALLDQRAIAGIGNVYKAEILFIASVDPFAPMTELSRRHPS